MVKEEDDDEPVHFTSPSWRTAPVADKPKKFKEEEEGEPIQVRVTKALMESKDFAEFKEKRLFIYVRLFAGKEDVLGESVNRLAKLDGLNVEVRSLSQDQPFGDIPPGISMRKLFAGAIQSGSRTPACEELGAHIWIALQ